MTKDRKIPIKNIYYMLTYAFNELKAGKYERIEEEDFDNIHDLFAEILIKGISYLLKRGLHREYIPKENNLTALRGKMNINGTLCNLTTGKCLLNCEFDELSENNLFNQILKSTVAHLLPSKDVERERKNTLRRLMLFFTGVSEISLSSVRWTSLRFDNNSKHYRMLLYICYFLASELLLTTEEGKFQMKSFSDERMNVLFERFVLEYYRKHHPELCAEAKQIDWNINKSQSDISHLPILQTDILLHLDKRTLIIDTKYYQNILLQHYDRQILHSHNIHQIHTYVTNLDVEHKGVVDGMLLYAKTEDDVVLNDTVRLNDGNIIMFRTLDLNCDFSLIKEQLENLIKYKM